MRQVPPGYPFNQRLKKDVIQPELEFDDHFEIDYHVRHTVLPGPGSREQLLDVVARMHANLLDRERPLWEFHLIEGLSGRRFAFYTKIHHVLCDRHYFYPVVCGIRFEIGNGYELPAHMATGRDTKEPETTKISVTRK